MIGQPAYQLTVLTTANWPEWIAQTERLLGSIECKSTITARYSDLEGDELTDDEKREEQKREADEKAAKSAGDEETESKLKARKIELKTLDEKEETKQCKAMFALEQSVSAEDRKYLVKCKTVRQQLEMLRRLKIRPENELALNDQLYRLQWGNETAAQFLYKLKELKAKIEMIRGSNEDAAFTAKLIRELPRKLGFTKRIIQSEICSGKVIAWQELIDRVEKAYLTIEEENEERAKRGRHGGRPNDRSVYFMDRKTCYCCGSIFHLVKDCPDRDREPTDDQRSRRQSDSSDASSDWSDDFDGPPRSIYTVQVPRAIFDQSELQVGSKEKLDKSVTAGPKPVARRSLGDVIRDAIACSGEADDQLPGETAANSLRKGALVEREQETGATEEISKLLGTYKLNAPETPDKNKLTFWWNELEKQQAALQ